MRTCPERGFAAKLPRRVTGELEMGHHREARLREPFAWAADFACQSIFLMGDAHGCLSRATPVFRP
jgi:hypothetical protein